MNKFQNDQSSLKRFLAGDWNKTKARNKKRIKKKKPKDEINEKKKKFIQTQKERKNSHSNKGKKKVLFR